MPYKDPADRAVGKAMWREHHRDQVVAAHRRYNAATTTQRAWAARQRKYGLKAGQLLQMWADQQGRCANPGCRILMTEEAGTPASVSVDHDHGCCRGQRACGTCVRGLLCWACNAAAGMATDHPGRLRGLADYIEGFEPELRRRRRNLARQLRRLEAKLASLPPCSVPGCHCMEPA